MRTTLIMVLFVALVISCRKSGNCDELYLDCSSRECIAYWEYFTFRLMDKTTGADLVFGATPKYTANDIKLYSDVGRAFSIHFDLDYNSRTILVMSARQEMYLEIKGADIYKLTAQFREESCCNSRVRTLWRDGQMICSCCPDAISLSVR
ncbi:MAG TPA: hypothetical protein VHQ93_12420 [Chitinophagaceae bacterium]|nr:hypothetical protein [Chitinophagaceae bacterium]